MVPIYAVCSFASFYFLRISLYIQLIRDSYEGFVVYNFLNLFLEYLGPDEDARRLILSTKPTRMAPPPWFCFTYNPSSLIFLSLCKIGVLQYWFIRITTAVIGIVMEYMGILCHGSMSPQHGNFYITVMNSISMGTAMFTLIAYYLPTRIDISRHAPVSQFMSIKFVIFFQFWLGLLMNVFVQQGMLKPSDMISIDQLSVLLPNLLTCIEMMIASIWHLWAFDYHCFITTEPIGFKNALWDSFYWLDLVYDIEFAANFLKNRSRSYHQLDQIDSSSEDQEDILIQE
jgi:hypothetical protein